MAVPQNFIFTVRCSEFWLIFSNSRLFEKKTEFQKILLILLISTNIYQNFMAFLYQLLVNLEAINKTFTAVDLPIITTIKFGKLVKNCKTKNTNYVMISLVILILQWLVL
jgi:hypothetical protein